MKGLTGIWETRQFSEFRKIAKKSVLEVRQEFMIFFVTVAFGHPV